SPNYAQIDDDLLRASDIVHDGGTLKSRITADIPTYIHRDPDLASALHRLRSSGKRLFLLTNSHAAYTREVMRWLLDGQRDAYPSWKTYFDVIITAAGKPSFFRGHEPFLELDDDNMVVQENVESFQKGTLY